ncbi:GNAT family N-acetyltransferase [Amaricoccus macauensis]|uniref:GNAT family N-acetyltransferase n=1 Tax=Amaricoccus macauensis TaxID=57001 RepID=UPI003C79A6DB
MHHFRTARPTDLDRCFEIEVAAYEGDEAATRERIERRILDYPQGFLIVEIEGEVAGFINSGCTHEVEMSDDAIKDFVVHDPEARNIVIMSVVVDPAHQGKGLSRALMVEFIARMRAMGKATIHLMCKPHHVPLYEKFGYVYLRPSASIHGGMAWHEMSMTL